MLHGPLEGDKSEGCKYQREGVEPVFTHEIASVSKTPVGAVNR